MVDFEFAKLMREQQRIYKDFPLPVIVCDDALTPHWANELAIKYYSHLAEPDGLRKVLREYDAEELLRDLNETGHRTLQELFPFSNVNLTLTPLSAFGKLKGALCMIIRNENMIDAADIFHSTKMASTLSNSIRDAVVEIFTILDLAAFKSDMMDAGWMKSGFNKVAFNNYRILRISNNIAEFARYQSGLLDMHLQPTDIVRMLRELRETVQALASSMEIPLWFDLPDREIVVNLDTDKFESALFNVLHNALYYTKQGNEVTIAVKGGRDKVSVTVTDRGLGIPRDVLPNVTRPYFTYSFGGLARGLGLGLANAKILVEAHEGKLAVRSVQGEGTTVTITLPILKRTDVVQLAQPADRLRLNDRFSPVYTGLADAVVSPSTRSSNKADGKMAPVDFAPL